MRALCSTPPLIHPSLTLMCSHFLAFKKPSYNKLLALFGNLPLVVPVAKKFREYHHDHHIFLASAGGALQGLREDSTGLGCGPVASSGSTTHLPGECLLDVTLIDGSK